MFLALVLMFIPLLHAELHFLPDSNNVQFSDDNIVNDLPRRTKIKTLNVYSYIAAILLLDQVLSTGTLISDRWLISAAESIYM